MNEYRSDLQHFMSVEAPYTSKGRRDKRKELLKRRTELITTLLKANNIMQREQARSER
jgi:hypothetical protein